MLYTEFQNSIFNVSLDKQYVLRTLDNILLPSGTVNKCKMLLMNNILLLFIP